MSGYKRETGLFELTATKAGYWFRRRDVRELVPNAGELEFWDLVVAVLRSQGLEVVRQCSGFIVVRATPEQLWEALSGRPSDPARAAHYYRQ